MTTAVQRVGPSVERWQRPVLLAIVGGLLVFLGFRAYLYVTHWDQVVALVTSADHRIYMDAADRIRAGGPVYPTWQLAGPYTLAQEPELYPPPTVFLLIVLMSFLPAVLWWLIPLTIVAAVVRHHRPPVSGWTAILLCLSFQWTWDGIASGAVSMWVAAAVALGTIWRPAFVLAFLKPSLFPFALLGARTRGWWVALAGSTLVSAAFLPLWVDYLRAMVNLEDGTLLYSIHNVPLILIPLSAWLSSAGWPAGSVTAPSPRSTALPPSRG